MFERGRCSDGTDHGRDEGLAFGPEYDRSFLVPSGFSGVRIDRDDPDFDAVFLDRDRARGLADALRYFADTGKFPWHLADGKSDAASGTPGVAADAFVRVGERISDVEGRLGELESSGAARDVAVSGLELRVAALEQVVGDARRAEREAEARRMTERFPEGTKVVCAVPMHGTAEGTIETPFVPGPDGEPIAIARSRWSGTRYYASNVERRTEV